MGYELKLRNTYKLRSKLKLKNTYKLKPKREVVDNLVLRPKLELVDYFFYYIHRDIEGEGIGDFCIIYVYQILEETYEEVYEQTLEYIYKD